MLLKVEGPKLPKSYLALFIYKSGGAQPYIYYSLSQKLGARAPMPIDRLRPCLQKAFLGDRCPITALMSDTLKI